MSTNTSGARRTASPAGASRTASSAHRRQRPRGSAALAAGALATALLADTGGAAAASTSASASGTCHVRWGSLPEVVDVEEQSTTALVGVRAGRHTCYDRLVVDLFSQPPGGYVVEYADPASATDTRVAGGAAIVVRVDGASLSELEDVAGEAPSVAGFRTFRQVTPFTTEEDRVETWRSRSTAVLGVRARLPFRTFLLDGAGGEGSRLVVDVAHHW